MTMFVTKFLTIAALIIGVCAVMEVSAESKKCAFVTDGTSPPPPTVELTIPLSALSHPAKDLPLEFHGVHPIVTRKTLPFGSMPKVSIVRYSGQTPPSIEFDEMTETVAIRSASCSAVSPSGTGTATTASGATSRRTNDWMTTMAGSTTFNTVMIGTTLVAAVMNENVRPAATLLALVAGTGTNFFGSGGGRQGFADAADADEACMPVVQVVVEAPAAYKGAIETCLEEVNDSAICPDPFPTYPVCTDPAPTCKVAVVGGGTGGLYTALRMVDEGVVEGSDICVFEQTERVGGRLVSLRGLGEDGDLVVDAGGYRTWPAFTPTAHALITEYLGISMDCYDDSVPCEVYNIVDDDGKKAGFAQFVEEMMQRLSDRGACFYPYHELVKIEKRQPTLEEETSMLSRQAAIPPLQADGLVTTLTFANGVTATATWTTVLNIPQRPLLSVVRNSDFDAKGLLDAPTLDALHSVQTVIAQKLYLYYPRGHVWWRKLGIRQGEFELDGDARQMLLAGRYHDGPVYCDDEADPDTCHGFLLAVYTNDLSGNKAQFFRRYQRDRPEPITIFTDQDLEGAEFLKHAHQRLSEFHQLLNPAANYSGFEASQVFNNVDPPPYAFLSTWSTSVPWAGGAWHSWTDLDNIEAAIQPFSEHNIFVVNEAYSLLQGWAEGAVKVADEILEEYFDVPRPWNFDRVDVNQLVRQTNSEECVVPDGSTETTGGGDGGDGDGGGGSSAEAAILCFEGSSLVEMADGSLKPIKDVQTGDFVSTGMNGNGRGVGLVTESLMHPVDDVNNVVPVAVVDTPFGELIGTPDHPIWWEETGEWMELQDLKSSSSSEILNVRLDTRHIDAFYNLEIDGNVLEEDRATHSYVVNGVTASGLGDHQELNRRYPRQKHFQQIQKQQQII